MHDGLLDTVAAVHAVDWARRRPGRGVAGHHDTRDALARWADYVEWSSEGDPLPALAEALAWCAARLPPEREPSCSGAMCGWATSSSTRSDGCAPCSIGTWPRIGPAEMDLGWHFGLEYMMDTLFDRRVAGFPARPRSSRATSCGAVARCADLGWHEVFALVRALAINDRHQRISGDRHRTKNPMGAVLLNRLAEAT